MAVDRLVTGAAGTLFMFEVLVSRSAVFVLRKLKKLMAELLGLGDRQGGFDSGSGELMDHNVCGKEFACTDRGWCVCDNEQCLVCFRSKLKQGLGGCKPELAISPSLIQTLAGKSSAGNFRRNDATQWLLDLWLVRPPKVPINIYLSHHVHLSTRSMLI